MKTQHVNQLTSNLSTPYWMIEVARRLDGVDIVDAINGLQALTEAMKADHKAYFSNEADTDV